MFLQEVLNEIYASYKLDSLPYFSSKYLFTFVAKFFKSFFFFKISEINSFYCIFFVLHLGCLLFGCRDNA